MSRHRIERRAMHLIDTGLDGLLFHVERRLAWIGAFEYRAIPVLDALLWVQDSLRGQCESGQMACEPIARRRGEDSFCSGRRSLG